MISVIMTVFNGERYISQAIDSILQQTYSDWCLVVIDDASTDNTRKIVEDKLKSFKNKYFIGTMPENVGHTKCLNEALKCFVDADYIAWQDSDDISHPKRFERQVRALQEYSLCTTRGITIDEKGRRVKNFYTDQAQREKKKIIHNKLKDDCWLLLPSLMFRREIIEKIGGFDEELYYSQDFNFFLRALQAGFDFTIIREELFRFRKHSKSVRASGKFKDTNWHNYAEKRARKWPVIKSIS